MTRDWQFLDEWFRVLHGAVGIYDPSPFVADQDIVRLGRDDDAEELWIDVRIHDAHAVTAAQLSARCLQLHEALVLTSMVAVVDYDAWRDALHLICGLGVPAAVDPDATPRRVQPQYRVQLPTDSEYDWASVELLLAGDGYKGRFKNHYAQVQLIAARHGVPLNDQARFRVRVDDCPEGGARCEQLERLRAVAATVLSLEAVDMQPGLRATLRLDSIKLSLKKFDVHSSVFREILAIVETGIEITQLSLPFRFTEYAQTEDNAARSEMWSLLASALCGRPQRPTPRPVCVRRLALSARYNFPDMLRPLLSALVEAGSLRSLKICAGSQRGDPDSFFWLWLGYTLLRPDSHCSVEVLDLDMVELSPAAIANLRDAMTTSDPLGLLWQKTTQTRDVTHPPTTSRQPVVVPAGTTVRPYGDDPGTFLDDFVVPVDWSGVLVYDDSTETTVAALLFGIGFCEIDRASLPNKRQRAEDSTSPIETTVTAPHNIHTLMLSMFGSHGHDEATPRVDDLLGLVGANLTALSLSGSDVNDQILERCLETCPKLQSLRLVGSRLTTMDPIIQSYKRGGQISSVELSAILVLPAFLPRFEAFFHELLTPSAIKRTLKKLRIGHQWADLFRQSTATVIKQVLSDPLTLDYLHVYRCENPTVAPPIDWDIASHQGQILPVGDVPRPALRVAFASVIKHLRMDERFARLNNDMVMAVFEFAEQKKRVVISEVSTYYNSRMFVVHPAHG